MKNIRNVILAIHLSDMLFSCKPLAGLEAKVLQEGIKKNAKKEPTLPNRK